MNELQPATAKPLRGRPFTVGDPRAGRKPGVKNHNTKAIKKTYAEAFTSLQQDPKHSLSTWAKKHPTDFYKLAVRFIPDEIRQLLIKTMKIQ